ncbi:unnamed protein product, partial [Hapterophycus canaliculatus]
VANAEEACQVLMRGYASRHTASTAMNSASSRSHAVFTLVIDTATALAVRCCNVRVRSARFNLVDLAGSERQRRTQAKGQQLKDAANINKSL